jgi:hypothetical protein
LTNGAPVWNSDEHAQSDARYCGSACKAESLSGAAGAFATGRREHPRLGRIRRRNARRPRSGKQHYRERRREVGQHYSIGRRIADNDCAYGAARYVAFGRVALGLGGQCAPTGATLCAGARDGARTIAGTDSASLAAWEPSFWADSGPSAIAMQWQECANSGHLPMGGKRVKSTLSGSSKV